MSPTALIDVLLDANLQQRTQSLMTLSSVPYFQAREERKAVIAKVGRMSSFIPAITCLRPTKTRSFVLIGSHLSQTVAMTTVLRTVGPISSLLNPQMLRP